MTQRKTQIVAYVRVSSADQNLARQLEAVGPVDRVFEEKVSGSSRADRTALAECIRYGRIQLVNATRGGLFCSESRRSRASAGVAHPSLLRGRVLSWAATKSR